MIWPLWTENWPVAMPAPLLEPDELPLPTLAAQPETSLKLPLPWHCQIHELPSVVTVVGVPAMHRLLVGAELKVPPFAVPQEPFTTPVLQPLLEPPATVPLEPPEPAPLDDPLVTVPPELDVVVPLLEVVPEPPPAVQVPELPVEDTVAEQSQTHAPGF